MITKKTSNLLLLLLILLLAGFLRIYRLGSLPISLFGDEIDVGYHALSLWTTAKDYTGQFLPTYIHSLSESRAPLLMYMTAPFVGLLGITPFSVRLPVAVFGLFNILLLYLLTKKLFNSKTGLIASLFLAISPWHIHYSRAAFEVTLLLSMLLLGTYLFIRNLNTKYFFLAFIPFALTFYTYSTATLFTPLLVLTLLLIYRVSIRQLLYPSLTFIILLPFAIQLFFGSAGGRFGLISIFNDQKLIDDEIVLVRTEPWVKAGFLETLFHNKPLVYLSTFGRQYLTTFSPQYLFISGDPLFRHSTSRFGELPWFLAPLLLIGIFYSFLHPSKESKFLLIWLLLAPIPSALTQGGGTHATRLFIMLPPLIIFSAIGFVFAAKNLKLALVSLILLSLFYVAAYWHNYSTHYRFESARFWNYGYEQAFEAYQSLSPSGRVFINNTYEPSLLRFAFYTQLPPSQFQSMFTTDVPVADIIKGFDGFKFGDRFYFGQVQNQGALQALLNDGDLYLGAQFKEIPGDSDWTKNAPAGLKVVTQVKDVFGDQLFSFITKN